MGSYEVLRQNADIAMYRVKNSSKGAAAFFDASMEREALARMKIEQSLRLAILEKRFCCAFQPKVDIRTQEVKGVEALVRLRDDEGVIQAPSTFINLATELGLIDDDPSRAGGDREVDRPDRRDLRPDTTISINVAAKQAGNPEFMRPFAEAIEATGFPQRFMIEVTEDAFVTKTHFRTRSCRSSASSASSLDRRFRHRLFVAVRARRHHRRRDQDRPLLHHRHPPAAAQPGHPRAIESLSEALGMTVIAEGIETFEELAYLQAATRSVTPRAYYFSRPIFLEDLKLTTPRASEARAGLASRPAQENRAAYSRAGGYRR